MVVVAAVAQPVLSSSHEPVVNSTVISLHWPDFTRIRLLRQRHCNSQAWRRLVLAVRKPPCWLLPLWLLAASAAERNAPANRYAVTYYPPAEQSVTRRITAGIQVGPARGHPMPCVQDW